MFDPWRALAAQPHIRLLWRPLVGRYGYTNGVDLIVLHPIQLEVEARCALTHELIHIERGHTSACTSAVERAVEAAVARRLIPINRLVDAHKWATSLDEWADELDVTPAVLRSRLDELTADEIEVLAGVTVGSRGLCRDNCLPQQRPG